jgi:hypothetical protein
MDITAAGGSKRNKPLYAAKGVANIKLNFKLRYPFVASKTTMIWHHYGRLS